MRTRRSILTAAVEEFAREGFAGARIDRISKAAGTNDRMLYYYFGNKQGLCLAAIEAVYEDHINAERSLKLNSEDPVAAIEELVAFHWDYYFSHPEFISILNSENLLKAKHLKSSDKLSMYSSPMLQILQSVLSRGIAKGVFRSDVTVENLFLTICSITYFYIANLYTLSNYLNRDLARPSAIAGWLDHAKRVVVASLAIEKATPAPIDRAN